MGVACAMGVRILEEVVLPHSLACEREQESCAAELQLDSAA
jgi:hypothetical protein